MDNLTKYIISRVDMSFDLTSQNLLLCLVKWDWISSKS